MRRSILLFLVAVAASLTLAAAPEFRLPGTSGGELTTATLSKGDIIVVVWAGWSPKCRDLPERVAELRSVWQSKASIVTVNFQEPESEVKAYLLRSPLGVPTYLDLDGRFSKSHAVTALPGLLVFRQGRRILKTTLGPDSARALQAALGS